MKNLRDDQRAGPPLKVWWASRGTTYSALLNSFAEAKVLVTALDAMADTFPVAEIERKGAYEPWFSVEGERTRTIDTFTLHQCVELDWAWAHRVQRENVEQIEGAAV